MLRWKTGWAPREPAPTLPDHPLADHLLRPVTPDCQRLQHPDPGQIQLTWIGHSTFLIQHQARNVLTDPIFGDCLTPIPGFRLPRQTPPGLRPDQLPPIHEVLISHNHYDHLDVPAIAWLRTSGGQPRFWLPSGLGDWFRGQQVANFQELAWGESASMGGEMEIHSVPAQHFAARGPFDRNRTHWCGWVLRSATRTIYFAGDTGYNPGFREIGKRFGGMDLALIPIGAYRPRWVMQPIHVDPFEAVKIHQDVGSRCSVGGHWGTFLLTDEPVGEPPALLSLALAEKHLPANNFRVLRPGETMVL